MIEVSLYSITPGQKDSIAGRIVARNRFNKEGMAVSTLAFVKGFLKDNLDTIEPAIKNSDFNKLITGDVNWVTADFATINYILIEAGYMVIITNVADDEENPTNIPAGTVEWNFIDSNFIQHDYPTATKVIPGDGLEVNKILRDAVKASGLYDSTKFAGIKNPFNEILDGMDHSLNISKSIPSILVSRCYELLDKMGIKVFCAAAE